MVKSQEYQLNNKKHLALVAPLDWGLGHTIRCIPVIRELQKQGFDILIACNSIQKKVLTNEFLNLTYVELPGYNLTYGVSRISTFVRLFAQLPKILISIKREQEQLKPILAQFNPKIVISDNRYGVFSSSIHSIFITHQLNIRTGFGVLADLVARKAIARFIQRFKTCWVPDFETGFTLAGDLSRAPTDAALPIKYIGALSRFTQPGETIPAMQGTLLVILSGPEPQRTLLERMLTDQLLELKLTATIVRGLPAGSSPEPHLDQQNKAGNSSDHDLRASRSADSGRIRYLDYADASALKKLISEAGIVICRSGYTSVMDLYYLKKRAILIPTPGQAEQEYLGRHLSANGFAVVMSQHRFNLNQALEQVYRLPLVENNDRGDEAGSMALSEAIAMAKQAVL